jgi:hypothetical protein
VHFVPVPGVCYATTNVAAEALPSLFSQVWPDLPRSEAPMIILNGIWNRIPAHHKALLKLAPKKHLLIADDLSPATLARRDKQRNVIRVEAIGRNKGVLRVYVEVG